MMLRVHYPVSTASSSECLIVGLLKCRLDFSKLLSTLLLGASVMIEFQPSYCTPQTPPSSCLPKNT
jgi:hypothetical protein